MNTLNVYNMPASSSVLYEALASRYKQKLDSVSCDPVTGKTRDISVPLDKLYQSSRFTTSARTSRTRGLSTHLAGSKTDRRGFVASPLVDYACVTSAHVVAGLIGDDWEKATTTREWRGRGRDTRLRNVEDTGQRNGHEEDSDSLLLRLE